MVRSRDEHRIDVPSRQQLLVMRVSLGAGHFARGNVQTFLIDVTKCHHLHVALSLFLLKHQAEEVCTPGAYPDHAYIDTVIRSQYSCPGRHG